MPTTSPKAAQYVRMSTDRQRYSIDSQLEAISLYAETYSYQIVRTYADEGRSGLDVVGRPALRRFLDDLHSPVRPFDVLLVYDVSRWGRFQDIDEGAYYEHLCKKAGVKVIYCGEPFENDGTALSNVIKALKRIMAAEYSREMSVKTAAGQYRAVLSGFHRGGKPGIGLSRVLLDEKGRKRVTLKPGQAKIIKTDQVVLAPGRASEIKLVTRIFQMFVHEGLNEARIAQRLNDEGRRTPGGAIWREGRIRHILKSERNIGTKIHGRVTTRLRGPHRTNPPDRWLVKPNAFPPIVPLELFEAAQQKFDMRSRRKTDEELLDDLRQLLAEKGHLSADLIRAAPGVSCTHTYYVRFGSLTAAYARIGFRCKRPLGLPARPDIEQLLDHLRRLLLEHGTLSRDLINAQPDGPRTCTYEWVFGSLGYAYSLVGYKAKGGKAAGPSEWRRAFVEALPQTPASG